MVGRAITYGEEMMASNEVPKYQGWPYRRGPPWLSEQPPMKRRRWREMRSLSARVCHRARSPMIGWATAYGEERMMSNEIPKFQGSPHRRGPPWLGEVGCIRSSQDGCSIAKQLFCAQWACCLSSSPLYRRLHAFGPVFIKTKFMHLIHGLTKDNRVKQFMHYKYSL